MLVGLFLCPPLPLISTERSEWRSLMRNSKIIIILKLIIKSKLPLTPSLMDVRDLQSMMTCGYKSSSYLLEYINNKVSDHTRPKVL